MFAIDCAAMTEVDMSYFTEKLSEKVYHFGPLYPAQTLCHHPEKPLLVDRVGRGQTFFEMGE